MSNFFEKTKSANYLHIERKIESSPSAIFIVFEKWRSPLGQFLNYRLALQMREPDRTLYLAVPLDTFESFFQEPFIQAAVKSYQVKLVIYNPLQEVIVLWNE